MIVEIAGQEKKIEAFIDLMRPFGIVELVRTGRIAMVRSIDRSNNSGTGGLQEIRRRRLTTFLNQFATEDTEFTEQ